MKISSAAVNNKDECSLPENNKDECSLPENTLTNSFVSEQIRTLDTRQHIGS